MTDKELETQTVKHQSMIKALARRYCVRGHYRLNEEDLYCEGLILLVEIGRRLEETDFSKMFRASLKHRFIDMIRACMAQSRYGVEIELDQVVHFAGSTSLNELYILKKLEHLSSILTLKDGRRVLMEVTYPSHGTVEEAVKDQVRRNHLFIRGVSGSEGVFKIRSEHVARALGITKSAVEACLREIRFELLKMAGSAV